jgi:phytoene synthase
VADLLASELSEEAQVALAWAPLRARPATAALLALDQRLGTILRQKREPILAQIRLAWWRDRLGEPGESWPGGDAVLDGLRRWREPAALAALVDGWEGLLSDTFDAPAISAFADGRARGFAALAGELGEGAAAEAALGAGRVWALADLVSNLSDPSEREAVLALARAAPPGQRLPRALRSLAVLAGLGRRAVALGGAPLLAGRGSAMAALRIGLAGR